jgi:hypothetical protein
MQPKGIKSIVFILFTALCATSSFAQQDSAVYKPSTLGITLGTFGAGINIELKINEKQKSCYSANYIRILGGIGSIGMGEYYYFGGAWQKIYGSGNHHFEMGYGVCAIYDRRAGELFPFPVLNWGYRFCKPNSRFYLRSGLGSPEVLYIGIGLGFGSEKKNELKNWENYEW